MTTRTGLDPFGHLCLDLERPVEWEDFLLGVDLDFALERRKIIEVQKTLKCILVQSCLDTVHAVIWKQKRQRTFF